MSKVKRKPPNFYSRPCGRGDAAALVCNRQIPFYFYSRPCGRGDVFFQREEAVFHISTHAPAGGATSRIYYVDAASYISTHAPTGWATRGPLGLFAALVAQISTHAPAGGATSVRIAEPAWAILFLLTPLREGRLRRHDGLHRAGMHFYSRPCGRGDFAASISLRSCIISTHAPAGGATGCKPYSFPNWKISTHAPAGGATKCCGRRRGGFPYFYSRPCGRGDGRVDVTVDGAKLFLLTPLREGRPSRFRRCPCRPRFLLTPLREGRRVQADRLQQQPDYFYSRPCGRGDPTRISSHPLRRRFLLTPLREGRPDAFAQNENAVHFYSRPCGRGDSVPIRQRPTRASFLLTPLREGRLQFSTSPS